MSVEIEYYFEKSRKETAFWANPRGQGNGEGTSLMVYQRTSLLSQDISLLPTEKIQNKNKNDHVNIHYITF